MIAYKSYQLWRSFFVLMTLAPFGFFSEKAWAQIQASPPETEIAKDVYEGPPSLATEPPPNSCRAILASQNPPIVVEDETVACEGLAGVIQGTLVELAPIELIDVEPPILSPIGSQQSPAQIGAAPSVQTVPQAGASVAYAGTDSGPRLIAALSANPFSIGVKDAQKYAVRSRIADVSVLLPIDPIGNATSDAGVDYVGVRIRVNAQAGDDDLEEAIVNYSEVQHELGEFLDQIVGLLAETADKRMCFLALKTGEHGKVESACGRLPEAMEQYLVADREALESLGKAREEADRTYFGLELAGDFGDPTFSKDVDASGSFIHANIAAGYRRSVAKLRLRVGAKYAWIEKSKESAAGMEAGCALELGPLDDRNSLAASAGIEFSRTFLNRELVRPADEIALQLGFLVPITEAGRLGIGVVVPLEGDGPVRFTVTGDMALLSGKSDR